MNPFISQQEEYVQGTNQILPSFLQLLFRNPSHHKIGKFAQTTDLMYSYHQNKNEDSKEMPIEDCVLRSLVNSTAETINSSALLPTLHYAVQHKLSIDLIRYLLKLRPETVLLRDEEHNLPLHLAMMVNAPKEVIDLLIADYPETICVPNKKEKTPLHLAFEIPLSEECIIDKLVRLCPQAVVAPDNRGSTPLHLSVSANAPVSTIKLLLRACSGTKIVDMKDKNGNTPLQLAIRCNYEDAAKMFLHTFNNQQSQSRAGATISNNLWIARPSILQKSSSGRTAMLRRNTFHRRVSFNMNEVCRKINCV